MDNEHKSPSTKMFIQEEDVVRNDIEDCKQIQQDVKQGLHEEVPHESAYDPQHACMHLNSCFPNHLYLSYLLCRWGDRMWEFAVGLFMVEIWKRSLLLTSLYGIVEMTAIVAFGVIVGNWVDKFPRLKNMTVVGATVAILILLLRPWPTINSNFAVFCILVMLVNLLGGISALASLATKISLERDWVIVMAIGSPTNTLTKMNAIMRRIDLSCTLLAAVFVGFLMSVVSIVASAIFMCTWNVVCVGIEYWLLLTVYKKTPRLHERAIDCSLQTSIEKNTTYQTQGPLEEIDKTPAKKESSLDFQIGSLKFNSLLSRMKHCGSYLWHKLLKLSLFDGWRVYMRQQDRLVGISFSLLSLSVLSFGTLMTASLKWRGCPTYILGLARGFAALIGIFATISYPFLQARIQTLQAGLVSILLQWSFLTLCVISIWVRDSTTSIALLMIGAAIARAGLWMFDLSVTQLMQESVLEAERGIVAGVQNTIQSFFQLLSFVFGMIIQHPKDFGELILISFGSVSLAVILYVIHVFNASIRSENTSSRQ